MTESVRNVNEVSFLSVRRSHEVTRAIIVKCLIAWSEIGSAKYLVVSSRYKLNVLVVVDGKVNLNFISKDRDHPLSSSRCDA